MSKLNIDRVKDAISGILDGAKEKPRKFVETIELQIGLKDYDTQLDKRFAGTVKLPHVPRMRLKVCILGDAVHCEQAQNLGMPFRSVDDLKKLNKNKKLVKKLARQKAELKAELGEAEERIDELEDEAEALQGEFRLKEAKYRRLIGLLKAELDQGRRGAALAAAVPPANTHAEVRRDDPFEFVEVPETRIAEQAAGRGPPRVIQPELRAEESPYTVDVEEPPLRPLMKIHPVTGRPALFVGRHAHDIPGLDADESERLLREHLDFACRPPRVLLYD